MQLVPSSDSFLSSMPSGREYHSPSPYQIPALDEDVLARMRVPPDASELAFQGGEGDSESDEESRLEPIGAFPGTKGEYSGTSSYY